MNDLLKSVEQPENPNIPQLNPGDMVSVHIRIKEGTTERIQEFRGTIISKRARGNDATFTVRRIASNGIGVERTFLTRSPRLEKVVSSDIHRCVEQNFIICVSALGNMPGLNKNLLPDPYIIGLIRVQ
jgi:large subunit ribosomal protein L19